MSVDIGSVQDFPDGRVSFVAVGRSAIGIVRWRGRIYAISAICAHQGGPLCRGVLGGRLTGPKPGDMALDETAPVIACPWHGWEFDVETGQAIGDSSLRIRTFPATIAGARVFIEAGMKQEEGSPA